MVAIRTIIDSKDNMMRDQLGLKSSILENIKSRRALELQEYSRRMARADEEKAELVSEINLNVKTKLDGFDEKLKEK